MIGLLRSERVLNATSISLLVSMIVSVLVLTVSMTKIGDLGGYAIGFMLLSVPAAIFIPLMVIYNLTFQLSFSMWWIRHKSKSAAIFNMVGTIVGLAVFIFTVYLLIDYPYTTDSDGTRKIMGTRPLLAMPLIGAAGGLCTSLVWYVLIVRNGFGVPQLLAEIDMKANARKKHIPPTIVE